MMGLSNYNSRCVFAVVCGELSSRNPTMVFSHAQGLDNNPYPLRGVIDAEISFDKQSYFFGGPYTFLAKQLIQLIFLILVQLGRSSSCIPRGQTLVPFFVPPALPNVSNWLGNADKLAGLINVQSAITCILMKYNLFKTLTSFSKVLMRF
jgi:hypothetical protein